MSFPIQICETDSVQFGCNISIVILLVPVTLRRAYNLIYLFYRPSIPLKKTNNSCTQRVKIVVNLGVIDLLNELLCNLAQLGLLDVVHHHRQHGQQLVLGKNFDPTWFFALCFGLDLILATRILQTVHLFNVAP